MADESKDLKALTDQVSDLTAKLSAAEKATKEALEKNAQLSAKVREMEIAKLSVGQNKTAYDTELRRFVMEDLPGEVTAGHELRYEITVQNKGASDAQNVQVLDAYLGGA